MNVLFLCHLIFLWPSIGIFDLLAAPSRPIKDRGHIQYLHLAPSGFDLSTLDDIDVCDRLPDRWLRLALAGIGSVGRYLQLCCRSYPPKGCFLVYRALKDIHDPGL
jgi:hypothetical protein